MISPPRCNANSIPSALLPEAVGPTMAMIGAQASRLLSFSKGLCWIDSPTRDDKPNHNDEPDDCKQQDRADDLVSREAHGLLLCPCQRSLGKLVFKCTSIRMIIRQLMCMCGR